MTSYADTSVLVALYVPEAFSAVARTAVAAHPQSPFTSLHELELGNALALMAGRRSISAAEYKAVTAQVREDVEAQRLVPVALDWPQTFADATALSLAHTAKLLTRSLDVLHVAAARRLGCEVFVSADDRQLATARAAGLKVVDIKRPTRRKR